METPFGPFEPTVDLEESQANPVLRSMEWMEAIMASIGRPFTIERESGQPLIVTEINGKRLGLPVFEAAELDCQRLAGHPTTDVIPLQIDGEPFTEVVVRPSHSPHLAVDMLNSLMLVLVNDISLLPRSLRDALK
jgi:hypothetical protein